MLMNCMVDVLVRELMKLMNFLVVLLSMTKGKGVEMEMKMEMEIDEVVQEMEKGMANNLLEVYLSLKMKMKRHCSKKSREVLKG
jgi:hypothetical protein